MWIEELTKSFYPDASGKGEIYEHLDYPYDHTYDFSKTAAGTEHWYIDHYKSSNFWMVIYGPCADPKIMIEGNTYQIFETLEKNEYIAIDSQKKTIVKILANGTEQNIFYKKATDHSAFEKIPAGDVLVSWNGEFGFDITVRKERSVPEWI